MVGGTAVVVGSGVGVSGMGMLGVGGGSVVATAVFNATGICAMGTSVGTAVVGWHPTNNSKTMMKNGADCFIAA